MQSRTETFRYFRSEPIWSAAVRQKKRMHCLFYPGCSYNITGYNPTVDIKYGTKMSYHEQVKTIVNWLRLPTRRRPHLIMAYFNNPDATGHQKRTDQVDKELEHVDKTIDLLLTSFKRHRLLDCVNLVIVSDHGMQVLHKKYYVNEMVNTRGLIVSSGVVGRIYLAKSGTARDRQGQRACRSVESVYERFQCKAPDAYRVYDRKRVPKRYHYAKDMRVGNVILEGRPGTMFWAKRSSEWKLHADHGYDYLHPNMRSIFFARGPNIRPRTQLQSFQNIELFNLFSDLLRLRKDTPNNGTEGVMRPALRGLKPKTPVHRQASRRVSVCTPKTSVAAAKFVGCDAGSSEARAAERKLQKCAKNVNYEKLVGTGTSSLCVTKMCETGVLIDGKKTLGSPTFVFERLKEDQIRRDASVNCAFRALRKQQRDAHLEWQSILTDSGNTFTGLDRTQFMMYKKFARGPYKYLQQLTHKYVRKYSDLLSITGTIYDFNFDGLADREDVVRFAFLLRFFLFSWICCTSRVKTRRHKNEQPVPSHIVRILIRCEKGGWTSNGIACRDPKETGILPFVLPNAPDLNCLSADEFLLANTARVRDIELLSGVNFFDDPALFNAQQATNWRVNVVTELWP
ncbi:Ectonucleotide pyrophosphatase/phosphodiesterase C27A7.1 [Aphelenchoides fujianensis]|nr:Ectonucleotide pyrophosphatase/phosphodiesterase C27A7.1 [Aphelenchoides fujianensis]